MTYRPSRGAWIGGVAIAVARKFGLNVIAVRLVALVALALFPLLVGASYILAAWLLRQPGGLQGAFKTSGRTRRHTRRPDSARPSASEPLGSRMRDLESRLAEIEAEIVESELRESRHSHMG